MVSSKKTKKTSYSYQNAYRSPSRSTKSRTNSYNSNNPAKKITLIIIALAAVIVVIVTILGFILTPENIVKSELSTLASDYYEKYYYELMSNSDKFKSIDDLESAMNKYAEKGFARVTLRQLILRDPTATANIADHVLKYCDEETTTVTFYPESPFERTSYHAEFNYSCAF